MAKTKISEFSATPGNNTDIDGINIAEGCAPSGINDAIRELMSQLKDFQAGTAGDSFNGPVNGTVGATTPSTGAFTNVTASGTLGVTGVATLGAGAILNTPASVTLTNATGLPISTGVSGLGTGVATALAVNVGSAGAPVINGGALGTPSSGTVTNLTGTASININGTVGATTANTGAFTTLTTSSTVTLNSGTANGVAYLNGSKVLTTGSALTFDGTNFVSSGIITSTNVNGVRAQYPSSASYYAQLDSRDGNSYLSAFGSTAAIVFSATNGPGTTAEGMRLTSTGLGIGTSSPSSKLDLVGVMQWQATAGTVLGKLTYSGGEPVVLAPSGLGLQFWTNNAFAAKIDASGNLGLGVTPSAFTSTIKALQIGPTSVFRAGDSAYTQATFVGSNARQASAVDYYIANGYASQYGQQAGAHYWYTAPSGTAGNAISFTQAMTLDASGLLLVGVTSPTASAHTFKTTVGSSNTIAGVNATTSAPYGIYSVYTAADPNNTGSGYFEAYNDYSATSRFVVRSNGGIANYQANDANLSDRREKINFSPAKNYLEVICSIPVQTFNYIDQNFEEDDGLTLGVVAQDVQAVAPELVSESNWGTKEEPKMRLSIYQTDLQYALMKCIQEQQAQIESLTQRLAAAGI